MASVWYVRMVTMVVNVTNNVVLVVLLQYVINLMVCVTAVRADIMVTIVTIHVLLTVKMKSVIEMGPVCVNLDTVEHTVKMVRF